MAKNNKVSFFGIPLPYAVIGFLLSGFVIGWFFPANPVTNVLYLSGTYFPKTVVTLAAFIIYTMLAGAMCKLVIYHKERAGRFFGVLFGLYLTMGIVSLIYVALWIPFLTDLPFTVDGVEIPGVGDWLTQIAGTFAGVMSKQPMVQALLGAALLGFFAGKYKLLRPLANGIIKMSDYVLLIFKKLLWYYPIMIGCLSIGIPMKFGSKGVTMYGQTAFWVALVIVIWTVMMIAMCLLITKRTTKQVFSYYGTVWPTGFGTSGSYDTLAVNIISAEHDLGLSREVAEVSIVFGTVLNKNCTTMAVLLTTITVARLLEIPISMLEIFMLIPPVLIMGLESPGVPGGAGFFMSPIIAVLLSAPDANIFVTTFVTVFSGFIPMFNASGNTTDDGVVGALVNDLFDQYLGLNQPAVAGIALEVQNA
jgi:Na+/H+-dicarboxylate symporter